MTRFVCFSTFFIILKYFQLFSAYEVCDCVCVLS